MKNHTTILLLTVLIPFFSSCYQSIGFTSEKADSIIEQQIQTSESDDYQTNQQYKVMLHDGTNYEYCCVAWQNEDVVFFYKINEQDGSYQPHGHFISSIKDIRYRDVMRPAPSDDDDEGGFFFNLLLFTIDVATDAAINSTDNSSRSSKSSSGKRTSRGSSSSSKSSGSKSVTGKRTRR